MRYILDHDLHIHSQISLCSNHPEQTTENILKYGDDNGFRHLCLTDHYWDENVPGIPNDFYLTQNYPWIEKALPLPQSDKTVFHFGCETDMNVDCVLGISEKMFDKFEFIIVPTTHLHMMCDPKYSSTEGRAFLCADRLEKLLNMDLPWNKIGIAHLTCPLLNNTTPHAHIDTLNLISDETWCGLYSKAAKLGAGIELNFPIEQYSGQDSEDILRVYRLAKKCGCKFYFGMDAHVPSELAAAKQRFEKIVDALELTEDDKFRVFG